MSDPILILTGPEEGPFLESKLRAAGSCSLIDVVHTRAALIQASKRSLYTNAPKPRLVAFCTNVLVPKQVLAEFRGGAYNFHPGSPDYPGSNAASFAIYNQEERYGVTAHEMIEQVDAGAIVGIENFQVPLGVRYMDLEILAYQHLLNLYDRLAPQIIETDAPLPPLEIHWGQQKYTQKDFDHMKMVSAEMDEDEIRLRWRAFGQ